MRPGERDIAIWLFNLTDRNINEFRFKDLPEELRLRKMILKSRFSGWIYKISTDQRCVATWGITKEGHLMASYGKNYCQIEKFKNKEDEDNGRHT